MAMPSWRPSLLGESTRQKEVCSSLKDASQQNRDRNCQWRPSLPFKSTGQQKRPHQNNELWSQLGQRLHGSVKYWGTDGFGALVSPMFQGDLPACWENLSGFEWDYLRTGVQVSFTVGVDPSDSNCLQATHISPLDDWQDTSWSDGAGAYAEGTVTSVWCQGGDLCAKAYCAKIGREVFIRSESSATGSETNSSIGFLKGQRLSFFLEQDLHDAKQLEGYDVHLIPGPGDYLGQRLQGEVESWSTEDQCGWIVCAAFFEGAIFFQCPDMRGFRVGEQVSFEVSFAERDVVAAKAERCLAWEKMQSKGKGNTEVKTKRFADAQPNAEAKGNSKVKTKRWAKVEVKADTKSPLTFAGVHCTVNFQRSSTLGCATIVMESHADREQVMKYAQRQSTAPLNYEASLDIGNCRVNLRRNVDNIMQEDVDAEIFAQWEREVASADCLSLDLIASTFDHILQMAQKSSKFVSDVATTLSGGGLALIRGETGCGKSLELPRRLCEDHGFEPLLCTQPRRLAAAGLVRRLKAKLAPVPIKAESLVPSDIGLHVGHAHQATQSTRLLYATAGVVLKQIQVNGPDYLMPFKCVVIDEAHERSVENDLLLACIRQFQKSGMRIKLVLMSATFNQLACFEWYKAITTRQVLREAPQLVLGTCFTKDVLYLEDVVQQLGNQESHKALIDRFTTTRDVKAEIDIALLDFVADVVVQLCACRVSGKQLSDTGEEKLQPSTILVFIPTYKFLDMMRGMLETRKELTGKRRLSENSDIFVLHGVLDLEECLETIEDTGGTRIMLASAVADSSITVPDCSFVVDLCRSNEVRWRWDIGQSTAALCWSSKSICDQRRGRTGRTRNGTVFRMVPRCFYERHMSDWEAPQIQLLNICKEVLDLICCAGHFKCDADALLQSCMDPPSACNVSSAKSTLLNIQAIMADSAGKHTPTEYGKLLSKLPVSLDHARLVVAAGRAGCLMLGVALAAVSSSSVKVISQRFGEPEESYSHALECFGANLSTSRKQANGRMQVSLAYVAAFCFWFSHWKCKSTAAELLMCNTTGIHDNAHWTAKLNLEARERSWCVEHHLSRAALHSSMETFDVVLEALHTYPQPKWLQSSVPFLVLDIPQTMPTCTRIFGDTACGLVVNASANISSNRQECTSRQSPMSQLLPPRQAFTKVREDYPLPPAHFKHVLLVGEGDLSFGRALQRLCRQQGRSLQVTSTTLLSKSELSCFFGSSVMETIADLSRVGQAPLHSVDATALQSCKHLLAHLSNHASCDLLQWNFPFTAEDDAVDSHMNLMASFFFSAARLILDGVASPDMEVRLLLHHDQLSRWRCRQAALDALFNITAWWEDYPLQDFERFGYVPRHTKVPERLPLKHPVLYCFRPCVGPKPSASNRLMLD